MPVPNAPQDETTRPATATSRFPNRAGSRLMSAMDLCCGHPTVTNRMAITATAIPTLKTVLYRFIRKLPNNSDADRCGGEGKNPMLPTLFRRIRGLLEQAFLSATLGFVTTS